MTAIFDDSGRHLLKDIGERTLRRVCTNDGWRRCRRWRRSENERDCNECAEKKARIRTNARSFFSLRNSLRSIAFRCAQPAASPSLVGNCRWAPVHLVRDGRGKFVAQWNDARPGFFPRNFCAAQTMIAYADFHRSHTAETAIHPTLFRSRDRSCRPLRRSDVCDDHPVYVHGTTAR